MFGDNVGFHVHATSLFQLTQCRVTQGVFYERKLQSTGLELIHGEAHAVYRDGTVQHEQRFYRARYGNIDQKRIAGLFSRGHDPDAIDVSLNYVSPQPVTGTQGALEVEPGSLFPVSDRSALECGQHRSRVEPARSEISNGEAGAVDGDALARRQVGERRAYTKLATGISLPDALYVSDRLDQPCEHLTFAQCVCGHDILAKLCPPDDWLLCERIPEAGQTFERAKGVSANRDG
jgi:hypothetical protein